MAAPGLLGLSPEGALTLTGDELIPRVSSRGRGGAEVGGMLQAGGDTAIEAASDEGVSDGALAGASNSELGGARTGGDGDSSTKVGARVGAGVGTEA